MREPRLYFVSSLERKSGEGHHQEELSGDRQDASEFAVGMTRLPQRKEVG